MAAATVLKMPGIEGHQRPINSFFKLPQITSLPTDSNEQLQEVDLNESRRKRQKTESPHSSQTLCQTANDSKSNGDHDTHNGTPGTGEHVPQPISDENTPAKPRKVLKLNPSTGTIGSPPAKKPVTGRENKRGRKPKSLLLRLRYAAGKHGTGSRIERIMAGEVRIIAEPPPKAGSGGSSNTKSKSISKPVTKVNGTKSLSGRIPPAVESPGPSIPGSTETITIPKTTHPFFLGKITPKPVEAIEVVEEGEKVSKGRKAGFSSPSAFFRMRAENQKSASRPHAFGASSKILKNPGAAEPLWPPRGMVHVRDLPPKERAARKASPSERKSKQAVVLTLDEDVLHTFSKQLDIEAKMAALRAHDPEAFEQPPLELQLPKKHFETGSKLQRRIRPQLKSDVFAESDSDDDNAHPAISRRFRSIATSLSAFDRSEHETESWVQKYAPEKAAEVLVKGMEAFHLRAWLQESMVTSVQSSQTKPKMEMPKKRRKAKLDDFVVSSEDEMEAADDSIIRTGGKTNAVVVSGPHGAGKTAMVYAVAKELGFDVFELNAGARRSGKDIMERVGDMTQNHMVKGADRPIFGEKKKKKEQRQSLILIEEADILYEEDKQFWPTVMLLMQQSKRPVVITCNDEALIPIQAMDLHAILRVAPAINLLVDYLLVVAANEGHALERKHVQRLCDRRDLRASLTELEVWCQMGVGDRKGGMEWFYPRWPRGCDQEDGETIRVISERTFHERKQATTEVWWDLSDADMCARGLGRGNQALVEPMPSGDFVIGYEALEEAEVDCDGEIAEWLGWKDATKPSISRKDFSAFDPIAGDSDALEYSVFDGPLAAIALDVAPYVRSIVAHDAQLQKERLKMSGARMRTTRAALSALEGGARKTTRLKWFDAPLNADAVMLTGCTVARYTAET